MTGYLARRGLHAGQQAGDHAAAPPGGAARGVMPGAEERLAGGRQWGVAGGPVPPAGGGGVNGGQPPRPVQVGRVPAVAIPRVLRVGDHLAVQGPVELAVGQPVPQLLPGLQQRVMGDLDTVLPKDQQPPGAENADDRVDVCGHRGSRGTQIGPAAPAPREPAIRRDHRQLGERSRRAASFCGPVRSS